MKRFAIFVAAILLAQTLSAQIITSRSHSVIRDSSTGKFALQKGYRGFAEGALMISPEISYRAGFNISTIHGYQFNRWFYLGVGAGFEGADMPHNGKMATAIPVFADFRCYFTGTRLKPFVEVQLGYTISCGRQEIEVTESEYFSDDVRYQYTYGFDKPHMLVGLGLEYKWLSLKFSYYLWAYTRSYDNQNPDMDYMIVNSFCIGIGFNF